MTTPTLRPEPFEDDEAFPPRKPRFRSPGKPKNHDPVRYTPAAAHARIKRLRDSHHEVLRFAAQGYLNTEIAEMTGYTRERVGQIINSPCAQDQIARYRAMVTAAWAGSVAEDQRQMQQMHRMSNRLIIEKLEDALDGEDDIALPNLLKIRDSMADRIGYHRKTATENVNVNFAANLERAISASLKARELTKLEDPE